MTILIGSAIVFLSLAYLLFFNKKLEQINWLEVICTVVWMISGVVLTLSILYRFGIWLLTQRWLTC